MHFSSRDSPSYNYPSNLMPTHPSKDLYEILGLSKESATDSTIRTAYRRLALRCHPDKQNANATDDEKKKAAEEFQEIGIAYAVLSDEKRKKTYDRTGRISEGIDLDDSEKDWDAYFRELWSGEVDASTIEAFAAKYKGKQAS
jgi:DnaJ family protein C protein 9